MSRVLSGWVFVLSMFTVFILGLGFVFGMYYISNQTPAASPLTSKPVTSEPNSLNLNVSSPDDNKLVFDPNLLVQGNATSANPVYIKLNNESFWAEPNSRGDFSYTLNLDKGVNNITITTFDETGNIKSEKKTVYYSSEKL